MINRTFYLFLLGLFFQSNFAISSACTEYLFETENLRARLLQPEDLEDVKKVQDSDEKTYLSAAPDEALKEHLEKQDNFSKNTLNEALEEIGGIGIGLFLKPDQSLIGMGTLGVKNTVETESSEEKPVSPSLETSLRLIKEERGKGYGTEYKRGLITYLINIKLIPTHQAGFSEETPYWGLSGLVDFDNKPSLKANINCGYGVFELLGNIVNVYYPRNLDAEQKRDGDIDLMSAFHDYLNKDEKNSNSGKKELVCYSLKRFANGRKPLNIGENIELPMHNGPYENSSSHVAFVINAIHDFPDVFQNLSDEEQRHFKEKFITENSKMILKPGQSSPEDTPKAVKTALENLNDLLN